MMMFFILVYLKLKVVGGIYRTGEGPKNGKKIIENKW